MAERRPIVEEVRFIDVTPTVPNGSDWLMDDVLTLGFNVDDLPRMFVRGSEVSIEKVHGWLLELLRLRQLVAHYQALQQERLVS